MKNTYIIYKWSIKCFNMSTNADEEMLACNADADAIVILMLTLMLLNLNK